jgi:hypothetical protein
MSLLSRFSAMGGQADPAQAGALAPGPSGATAAGPLWATKLLAKRKPAAAGTPTVAGKVGGAVRSAAPMAGKIARGGRRLGLF